MSLPHRALPQPDGRLDAIEIGRNVVLISGAGSNVVTLGDAAGAVMIDGGAAEHAPRVLDLIQGRERKRPVLAMFNTHWHYDHTGSNELLGSAGTRIFAHENTKLWLGGDFYVEWQDRHYRPRPSEALPTDTFYTSDEITLAGEVIEYGHLPRAHTDGDVYVFIRGSNVLVVGDTVSTGSYPVSDYSTGGWPVGLMDACDRLLELADDETRIVAGQGFVLSRAHVQAQRDMLAVVTDRLMQMMAKGMSAADMLAAGATQEFDVEWGDPRLFINNAYKGLWAHVFALTPRPI